MHAPVQRRIELGAQRLQAKPIASGKYAVILKNDAAAELLEGETVDGAGAAFENVDFAYDEQQILSRFSLRIAPGKMSGVCGKSGSGKSTMLRLMMRFWDVKGGTVRVGKGDVRHIRTASLRAHESFMTQQTHLFHDSILNNIRLVRPDASREEVEEACRKASIHEFIMSLPAGYDTEVGELGDTLSGGERQRIGLARVFLHDSALILLDEPTSNLDSLNEAVILKSLHEQKAKKTIVLVSHRHSVHNLVFRNGFRLHNLLVALSDVFLLDNLDVHVFGVKSRIN